MFLFLFYLFFFCSFVTLWLCYPRLTAEQKMKRKQTITQIITNTSNVLSSLVHMEPTVTSLGQLLQKLEFWIVSKKVKEREAAVATYLVLLKKFMSKLTADKVAQVFFILLLLKYLLLIVDVFFFLIHSILKRESK